MKTITGLLAVLGISLVTGWAQTNQMELRGQTPVWVQEDAEKAVQFQMNLLQRIFGPTATTSGVIPTLLRPDERAAMRDPFAPVSRVRPFSNVAENPRTGRAEGIVLFAIHF